MMDKKKLAFWRLAAVFGSIAILMLFFLWNSPNAPKSEVQSGMMASSMGNMMKSKNLKNITIYDLFGGETMNDRMASMSMSTMSHSDNMDVIKYKVGFWGTIMIFLLLPFIIGGTVILAIIWMK